MANETEALMWGSPGTLIVARHMLDWTQDARWREAWDESADALLRRRDADGLWTQQLYGHTIAMLGPVHGLVGNVLALGRGSTGVGQALFAGSRNAVLERTAVVENGLANWPPRRARRSENTRERSASSGVTGHREIVCIGGGLSRRGAPAWPAPS